MFFVKLTGEKSINKVVYTPVENVFETLVKILKKCKKRLDKTIFLCYRI